MLTRDPVTGKNEIKRIVSTSHSHVDATVSVVLAEAKSGRVVEMLTGTRRHPFYVEGKGFVPAGALAIGNSIVTRAGPALVVQSVIWNRRAEGYDVFNFVVEDDHSYFVGKANGGAWVHNVDCLPGSIHPDEVRFSQSSIKSTFTNGANVDEVAQGLKDGTIAASNFPPIRLVEKDGQLFTLDNRRLEAFRRAGVKVPYRMATPGEIANEGYKFTSRNGGRTIRVRGE